MNNLMLKNLWQIVLISSILSLAGCISYPNKSLDMKDSMQRMQRSYDASMRSENMNEFKSNYFEFKDSLHSASSNRYNGTTDEQEMYMVGMIDLAAGIVVLDAVVSNENLQASKNAMSQLLKTKNEYHQFFKIAY